MTPEQITALAYETGLLVGDMPPLQRHAEAIERFARSLLQADNSAWRKTVDDALVNCGLDCTGPDTDPQTALMVLLSTYETILLDPAVSSRARDLVDKGRAEMNPFAYYQLIKEKNAALNQCRVLEEIIARLEDV